MESHSAAYKKSIRAPKRVAQVKKEKPEGGVKYHFCFSAVDPKKAKHFYLLIDKLFGDYDFISTLRLGAEHYVCMWLDEDKLTHIDFIGEEWTCEETDYVFAKIRALLRANNLYFAFTNYHE